LAQQLSGSQSAKALELRAATSLARLLAGRQRFEAAAGALRPLFDSFSEGLDTADLCAAREVLDRLA
jgi:predicted ATPase